MIEIWKPVEGFEDLYEVSNLGRIKSCDKVIIHRGFKMSRKGRIMKTYVSQYEHLILTKESKKHFKTVHRLVAEAFIPNPENKPHVNHINGIKTDNCISNLEWCSVSENAKHAHLIGLAKSNFNMKSKFGKKHHNHKKLFQYSSDLKLIEEFNGTREAERITGINQSCISLAANGKLKKAGGFIWSFSKLHQK